MTKLKELLDINEEVEKHFNEAVEKRAEICNLKDKARKLLIIQKHTYKSAIDYIKEWLEREKLNKKIENVESDFEQIVFKIYEIRNTQCNHDILLLINKHKNTTQEIGECLCPICGSKTIKDISNCDLNIIDEIENPNKKEKFGEKTELEIEYLSNIKRIYLRNEEATVADFLESYSKKEIEKSKRKTLI